jgi:hypothetical protein
MQILELRLEAVAGGTTGTTSVTGDRPGPP